MHQPKQLVKAPSPQLSFEEALLPGWNTAEGSSYTQAVKEAKEELSMTAFVPVFTIRMVRLDTVKVKNYGVIRSPRDVYNLLNQLLKDTDREHFMCLVMNTKNFVMGVMQVSMGDLNSTIVHPREVFKAAIAANAASIIVAHNHPTGDPALPPKNWSSD